MGSATSRRRKEGQFNNRWNEMDEPSRRSNMEGPFNNRWSEMDNLSRQRNMGRPYRGGAGKTKRRSTRKPTKSARKSYRRHRKKSQCVGKSKAFCARTRARYRASGGVTKGCKWASGPKVSFCRSVGNTSRAKSKKSAK